MSNELQPPRQPRQSRWRFTLAGLFVLVLGVAAGMGWWRLRSNEIGEALLAAATVWFTIGMLQQCLVAWRRSREASLPGDVRFGHLVVCVASAALPAMLLLAAVATIGHRHNLWHLDKTDFMVASAFGKLVDAVFFFAILGGYLTAVAPATVLPKPRWRRLTAAARPIVSACGAVAGAALLILMLTNVVSVPWLVHVAIRGVHYALPLSWDGVRINEPVPLHHADGAFLARGAVAAGLFAIAALLIWLMGRSSRLRASVASGTAAVASLVAVAALVGWCYRVGFPAISPHLAENMHGPAPVSLVLASALAVAAATALALRWTAQRDESQTSNASSNAAPRLLQNRGLVLSVLLLGCAWELTERIDLLSALRMWQGSMPFWMQVEYLFYAFGEPHLLLRWAVIGLLAGRLWQRVRRHPEPTPLTIRLPPARFAFTWLLCLALLILAGPVAAWAGFAILMSMGVS